MKLKTLPSQRESHRYIFFKIHSDFKLNYNEVKNAVTNSAMNWLGSEDFAKSKLWLIKNMFKPSECVIKCSHKYVDEIKVSLALLRQIGDSKVIFQSYRVSGTIKSGKSKN